MEIKTATWGWYPPKYELVNSTFKIYFNPVESTETRTHRDPETNEETSEDVTVYTVNYIEKKYPELLQAIKDKNDILVSKLLLIERINAYDASDNVNSFTLDGNKLWLDKSTRVGLMNSLNIERDSGVETSTIWYNGKSYDVTCDKAINVLKQLELYAVKCYNTTATHLETANSLTTVDKLDNFDYRADYPEKLKFQLVN